MNKGYVNTYFRIRDAEHFKEVQKFLLEEGFEWYSKVDYTLEYYHHTDYIRIDERGSMFYGRIDMLPENCREVFLSEPIPSYKVEPIELEEGHSIHIDAGTWLLNDNGQILIVKRANKC